jgi:hypothetical protein
MSIETTAVHGLLPFVPAASPLEICVITFASAYLRFDSAGIQNESSLWVFRWSLFSVPKTLCITCFWVWVVLLETVSRLILPALMDLYIHPLYVLVSKIHSSILNYHCLILASPCHCTNHIIATHMSLLYSKY